MKYIYEFDQIDCANCAAKVEAALGKDPKFQKVSLRFMLKELEVHTEEEVEEEQLRAYIQQAARKVESDVIIKTKGKTRRVATQRKRVKAVASGHSHGEGCGCGGHEHEHSHEESCGCGGHEHEHSHEENCGCGGHDHDHGHSHGESCGCEGHEHDHGHSHGESCGCGGHEHEDSHEAKKSWQMPLLGRVGLGILGVVLGSYFDQTIFFVVAYLIVGYDVLLKAGKNILRGKVFDENFLMALATVAAFVIKEYPEAVAVMVFYQVGEYLQHRAVSYSRAAIADLMNIRPDFARVVRDGIEENVAPEEVEIGEIIQVRPGEKIPLDGRVIKGSSLLDKSMLTGESMPESVEVGMEVLSGSINQTNLIEIEVTKTFETSTVSKILELIQNASSQKAEAENFITKFAKWYTPLVVIVAVAVAIIPSLVTGDWHTWIYNSIVFLVISCPCALVVSVPLGFFGGIGAASKRGVLVKGGNYLEALNTIDTIVLDKTGTITEGVFGIRNIEVVEGVAEEDVLRYAKSVEKYSNHPIAAAIVAYNETIMPLEVLEYEEKAGYGIMAQIQNEQVSVGNEKLMALQGILCPAYEGIGTIVYVAVDRKYMGYIELADQVKSDSKAAIAAFKKQGIKQVVMLTGDKQAVGNEVAKQVGITKVYGELLPQDKVTKVKELMDEGCKVAFVGDGMNDAPVLAMAHVGIAMGGVGSDVAIEASDIVLMTDELSRIGSALNIAKKTKQIVTQNIVFAIGIKIIVMILGLFSIANMWLAVFADVGVSLLAILNAIRVLKYKD
ncbi:MAG: heavy metal translocating P-type ATPase [Cellulosilyticaceae bacterium]